MKYIKSDDLYHALLLSHGDLELAYLLLIFVET